ISCQCCFPSSVVRSHSERFMHIFVVAIREPVVMSLRQIIPSGLGRVLLGEALATRVDPGGNFQVMNPFCWARIARPSESLAGFNCAYIAMISQVSLSSDLKPLLSVTSHDEITPVGSIVRRNATRPCSPRLSAPGG